MRRAVGRLLSPVPILGLLSGCGGGASPSPTSPTATRSFLEGTWSGTVTIERAGEVTTSGAITWTFETVPATNMQTFRVTIRSQHAWLPITTTVTSAITPSNTAPARISTQGDYPSPRGCTGSLLSVGNADTGAIDADFNGVDCTSLQHSTFRGRVSLTKTGG
jgi:hypothetical protein